LDWGEELMGEKEQKPHKKPSKKPPFPNYSNPYLLSGSQLSPTPVFISETTTTTTIFWGRRQSVLVGLQD
jgi:hypothetical protein